MKLNAGIVTTKIEESKKFYSDVLGFGVTFENEFYLLMHTPDHSEELSFLAANHPSQNSIFHTPYGGQGVFLTIELDDVDSIYESVKGKDVKILVDIKDEPWGDRHFTIQDPNGVNIDIVRYTAPVE